jgi:amino acid transporter
VTDSPRSMVSEALAADRLGAPTVVAFAMTAAAPLMTIGGVVTIGWATAGGATGITGYPLAFLVIAALLGLFAIGYMAMSKRVNNTGAFYSYVARGAGRPAGVAASFVAFLAYNLMQVGLYGIFGATVSGFVAAQAGLNLDWWIYSLAAWLVVTCLGVLRVDINGKLLLAIVAAEVVVVIVFDTVFLANPAGGVISLSTFDPSHLFLPGIGAILVTVVTSFVGFEAAAVYSEESRNRRRTVPVATYLALFIMVLFYAGTSWAIAVTVGDDALISTAQDQQTEMIFETASIKMGSAVVSDVGIVLLITSIFAAMLSYHNTVARYTFALAREGVLPRGLARTGIRSGAPRNASLLQSVIGGAVIIAYAFGGGDPLTQLFFWLGMTGGFGILVLITATAVAVLGYFARHPGDESVWARFIAPAVSAVLLLWIVYVAIDSYASLLGFAPDDPNRNLWWIFPAGYAVVALLGVAWAMVLRGRSPDVYAGIGRGSSSRPEAVGEEGDSHAMTGMPR